jgi:hypothetical protein
MLLMTCFLVPKMLLKDCLRYQVQFNLSYSQLSYWLYNQHGIKITPMGLRKALLREFPID